MINQTEWISSNIVHYIHRIDTDFYVHKLHDWIDHLKGFGSGSAHENGHRYSSKLITNKRPDKGHASGYGNASGTGFGTGVSDSQKICFFLISTENTPKWNNIDLK